MPRLTLRATLALAMVAAVLAGCSNEAEVAKPRLDAKRTDAPSTTLDSRFCETFINADNRSVLRPLVGDEFAPAIDVLEAFSGEATGGPNLYVGEDVSLPVLQKALAADGAADALASLAEAATTTCATDATVGSMLTAFAVAAAMSGAPKVDDYCRGLASMNGLVSSSGPAHVEKLQESAPAEHRDALEALLELTRLPEGQAPDTELAARSAGALMGVGLYSQLTCGTKHAFTTAMMATAVLFSLIDGASSTSEPGSTTPGGSTGNAESDALPATPADPGPANAALNTVAEGLSFDVSELALEDTRGYHASVVHPAGWTLETGISSTFEPPMDSGWSIFDEVRVSAGCDGVCQPTDWQSRLRGPDGYLTGLTQGSTVTVDRPVSGSAGVVLVLTNAAGDPRAAVVRWLDTASRYFLCEVRLSAERASLIDAFVTACEASRPGWIPVG